MEKEFSRGEYFIFCKTEHKQPTNNLEKRKRSSLFPLIVNKQNQEQPTREDQEYLVEHTHLFSVFFLFS